MPFTCSICAEESTRICARCTKDACNNHLCEKCRRCSDCCECEVARAEFRPDAPAPGSVRAVWRMATAASAPPEAEPVQEAEAPAPVPTAGEEPGAVGA